MPEYIISLADQTGGFSVDWMTQGVSTVWIDPTIPAIRSFDAIYATWERTGSAESSAFLRALYNGFFSGRIRLDGATPIIFNAIPAGFKMLNASVHYVAKEGEQIPFPNGTATLHLGEKILSPVIDSSTPFVDGPIGFKRTYVPVSTDPNFTASVLYQGWSLHLTAPFGFSSNVLVDQLYVSGDYDIVSFSYDLNNNDKPIIAGAEVRLEDAGGTLDTYDSLFLTNGAGNSVAVTIISQTPFSIVFKIPSDIAAEFINTNLNLWGHQFSGSVKLGLLVILLADASGIYKLVPGKTNDTLYDRTAESTIDVPIPDPFIKTGFIK